MDDDAITTTIITVRIECSCERHARYQGITGRTWDDGLTALFTVTPDKKEEGVYEDVIYVRRTCCREI